LISFSRGASLVFKALFDMFNTSPQPCMGLRISQRSSADGVAELQITGQPRLDPVDELFLAPGGILVFIDPSVVSWVSGGIIEGSFTSDGEPSLVLLRQRHQRENAA